MGRGTENEIPYGWPIKSCRMLHEKKKKSRVALQQQKYCGSGEEMTAAGQMLEWRASEVSKYSYVK